MKRSDLHWKLIDILKEEAPEVIEVGHITGRMLDACEEAGMKLVREKIEQHVDGVKYIEVEGWDEE